MNEESKEPTDIEIKGINQDENNHLHEAVDEDNFGSSSDTKNILILVGVTVALFLIVISGFSFYNDLTSAGVVSIDDLHRDNLEGNLDEEFEAYVHNGFSFVKAEGLWWTEINKFGTRLKIPLHFSPKELNDVKFTGDLNPNFNIGENVYVSIDPKVISEHYTLAISELSFNMVKGMDRIPVGSCIEENEACIDRDIINCDTANGKPVIELQLSEISEVEFKNTCIIIKGTEWDLVKGVNRVLYHWYGIID